MSDSFEDWMPPKIQYSESAGMAATQALRDFYKSEMEKWKATAEQLQALTIQLQADLDRWEKDLLKRNGLL